MKKLLTLLLILLLCMAMTGCGGEKPSDNQIGAGVDESIQGDNQEEDENTGYLDTEDLYIGEDPSSTFDFGFTAEKTYPMEETVTELDAGDISVHGDSLSKQLAKEAGEVFGAKFTGYGDYIEDPEEGVTALTEAVAIEDGDSGKRYLASGIYNTEEGEIWQYTRYAAESLYKFSEKKIKEAIADIKAGYGVSVSQEKAEAAYKEVLEKTESYGGYYVLSQTKEIDRGDYVEQVSVYVEGFQEGEVCCYLCVERAVRYK